MLHIHQGKRAKWTAHVIFAHLTDARWLVDELPHWFAGDIKHSRLDTRKLKVMMIFQPSLLDDFLLLL